MISDDKLKEMLSAPISNEAEARAVGMQLALEYFTGKAFVSSEQILDLAGEYFRWIWFGVRADKKGTNGLGPN